MSSTQTTEPEQPPETNPPSPTSPSVPSTPDSSGKHPGTEDEDHAHAAGPGKRRKINLACESCRRRKVRCDSVRPSCTGCLDHGLACVYPTESKKRGPRQGYLGRLEARLEEMENTLRGMTAAPGNSPMEMSGQAEPRVFALIEHMPATVSSSLPKEILPEDASSNGLPPLDVTLSLLDTYFETCQPLDFIHRSSTLKAVKEGHLSSGLLFSLLAVAVRRSSLSNQAGAADHFADRARSFIDCSVASLDTIRALMNLTFHEISKAGVRQAWLYEGIAIRMAQDLGLHRLDDVNHPEVHNRAPAWASLESRRRLWWVCFLFDRFAGAASGRPLAADDRDCQVRLPGDERAWREDRASSYMAPMFDPEELDGYVSADAQRPQAAPDSLFASLVRLAAIVGRIGRYIGRPRPRHKPAASSPGSEFRTLDAALVSWHASLPPDHADPMRSTIINLEPGSVLLHVYYHAAVILLHRSNLQAQPGVGRFRARTAFANSSLSRVKEAATCVSDLAERLTTPEQTPMPIVSFSFFTAATVHLDTLFSDDPAIGEEERAHARSSFDRARNMVQKCARYWGMAVRHLAVLDEIGAARQAQEAVKEKVLRGVKEGQNVVNHLSSSLSTPHFSPNSKAPVSSSARHGLSSNSLDSLIKSSSSSSSSSSSPSITSSTPAFSTDLTKSPTSSVSPIMTNSISPVATSSSSTSSSSSSPMTTSTPLQPQRAESHPVTAHLPWSQEPNMQFPSAGAYVLQGQEIRLSMGSEEIGSEPQMVTLSVHDNLPLPSLSASNSSSSPSPASSSSSSSTSMGLSANSNGSGMIAKYEMGATGLMLGGARVGGNMVSSPMPTSLSSSSSSSISTPTTTTTPMMISSQGDLASSSSSSIPLTTAPSTTQPTDFLSLLPYSSLQIPTTQPVQLPPSIHDGGFGFDLQQALNDLAGYVDPSLFNHPPPN
ncbi:MAG: fungal-specific transcription factor domain-containing protein [Piptocephalis tieghemiana]|nr:MAG: fungal-specific transcription factor domain-containing protein [Piptocephalis tieghemiana]